MAEVSTAPAASPATAPAATPAASPAAPAPTAAPAESPASAASSPASSPAPAVAAPAAAPAADGFKNLFDEEGGADAPNEGDKPTAAGNMEAPAYELALPEGMELDADAMKSVHGAFTDAGVPADKAQGLFDRFVASVGAARQAALADATKHWESMQQQWKDEVAADKEIGGARLQDTLRDIRSGALALTGVKQSQAFMQALNLTGAGNHPAVVRMLHAALSPHAASRPVNGGKPTGGSKGTGTPAQSMYPSATGGGGGTPSPLSH